MFAIWIAGSSLLPSKQNLSPLFMFTWFVFVKSWCFIVKSPWLNHISSWNPPNFSISFWSQHLRRCNGGCGPATVRPGDNSRSSAKKTLGFAWAGSRRRGGGNPGEESVVSMSLNGVENHGKIYDGWSSGKMLALSWEMICPEMFLWDSINLMNVCSGINHHQP